MLQRSQQKPDNENIGGRLPGAQVADVSVSIQYLTTDLYALSVVKSHAIVETGFHVRCRLSPRGS